MSKCDLAVIMPIYNEEASIEYVFKEWIPALNATQCDWRMIAIDDGSKDQTLKKLNELKALDPHRIIVHSHTNRGHGQSCVRGYEMAIDLNAEWTFQIDSDGQCDPAYFEKIWAARNLGKPVYGFRVSRDDGQIRWWISRIVSTVVLVSTFIWVRDPNVPYRLIPTQLIRKLLPSVPRDFHLTNILISALVQRENPIHWINIHFRDRYGGSPSVKSWSFAKQGGKLIAQLWKAMFFTARKTSV